MIDIPRTPDPKSLRAIKTIHTVIWAFFVTAIAAIWIGAATSNLVAAAWAIGVVLVEIAVLAANHGRCPLGAIAARYTNDRQPNFDIYLPNWLAARTKPIFGTLFVGGVLFAVARWFGSAP